MIEDTILAETSACEVRLVGEQVHVRIGGTVLILDPMQFAASSGTCRTATKRLFTPANAAPA